MQEKKEYSKVLKHAQNVSVVWREVGSVERSWVTVNVDVWPVVSRILKRCYIDV